MGNSMGLFDGFINGWFPWFLVCFCRYHTILYSRIYDTYISAMFFMGLKIAEVS